MALVMHSSQLLCKDTKFLCLSICLVYFYFVVWSRSLRAFRAVKLPLWVRSRNRRLSLVCTRKEATPASHLVVEGPITVPPFSTQRVTFRSFSPLSVVLRSSVNLTTMEMEYKLVFGIYAPTPNVQLKASDCFKK